MATKVRWVYRVFACLVFTAGAGVAAVSDASAHTAELSSADDVGDFLSELAVAPEGSMSGYDRDEFPHWLDEDGDCVDARHEVLAQESSQTVGWDDSGCNVVSGQWWSAFGDVVLTDPSDVSIDHMVALAEAWRSGASAWTRDTRQSFANHLDADATLRGVTVSSNSSKGDRDPADWMPSNTAFHCQYLFEWVEVKETWALTVDQAEYDALYDGLLNCDL